MRIFTAIEDLIRSKEGQYGRQDDFPTHRILARLDPHFRAVNACKHLFAYVRTRALKELVKAAAYIALEYEERQREEDKVTELETFVEWLRNVGFLRELTDKEERLLQKRLKLFEDR